MPAIVARDAPAGRRGLTLIEILVVLFIIGLGWFTLLPRLDLAGTKARGDAFQATNTLLEAMRLEAAQSGVPQVLAGTLGSSRLAWRDKAGELPGAVARIAVNGIAPSVQGFSVRVYPCGVMDNAVLTLTSGARVAASPLACRLEQVKAEDRPLGEAS